MTQGHPAGPTLTLAGEPVDIRSYRDGDRGFVVDTWIRSYGAARARMPRSAYRLAMPRIVEDILARPSVVVRVACSPERTSTIYGYAVAEGDALHFAYVPHDLRGNGLARALITSALGGYGARIETSHRWPWPSSRFAFVEDALKPRRVA